MQSISIPVPDLFNFNECLWFLDRGYDDCLHRVEGESVLKLLNTQSGLVLLKITFNNQNLQISVVHGEVNDQSVNEIKVFVKSWFDLERNLETFYVSVAESPTPTVFNDFKGLRMITIPDLFEALCWSVIGQQINLTFAYSLKRRLVELCGNEVGFEGEKFYAFPAPPQIKKLTIDQLRERQFSQRKAEYLKGLAELFVQGDVNKDKIAGLGNTQEMVNALCDIRGIGEWSANYALMKSLCRMDCITHGDTGLQAAIRKINQMDRKPTRDEVVAFMKPFAGWESYTVFYLWRILSPEL